MKLNKIKVLSSDEIKAIHSATMELMSTVGVKMDAKDVQDLFEKNGATVDPDTNFVKIPESLVKEQLKNVPNSFKLHGPDGSYSFEVNTESTKFASLPCPVSIYDETQKKGIRKSTLADTIKQIRIVNALEHISSCQYDLWAHDVPFLELHCHTLRAWARHSYKPYGMGCFGKIASQDMMNICSIIVGGEEELIKRPRLIGFLSPTSPLHLPQIMTNGLAIFAKYKQPTIIAPEALAGISAPVTLAGLLTQINAEILGGIILVQLYNSGAPVFYGSVSHVTDMKSGNSALGSIETGLITVGVAQMANLYNIPSRALGGATDSKVFDLQNGIERLQTLMLAAQAGINYITCAGTYEATLSEALELLVIDDELVGMVQRALEGVEVNEDTIGLDIIKKVATSTQKGTTFLGEKHTLKHMRKELYFPTLLDRNRRATWRKKGSKDIMIRARERVDEILETQKGPGLSSEVENKLAEYIKMVSERSIDFYTQAEGISASSVTIDNIEIKKEDLK